MTRLAASLQVLVLVFGLAPVTAGAEADPDHERAWRLRQQGDILPLQTVVEGVLTRQPGRLIEVELDRIDDGYVYEVEILDPGGNLRRFYLDARSGQSVAVPPEHH